MTLTGNQPNIDTIENKNINSSQSSDVTMTGASKVATKAKQEVVSLSASPASKPRRRVALTTLASDAPVACADAFPVRAESDMDTQESVQVLKELN